MNGNGGRARRLSAGGMLDQLEYASDALEQTLRTAESSSSDEWSPKSRDEPSAKSKGPLSPVPEREAANRGNVAKGRAEYNAWAAKHAQSQTQSRGRREREGGRGEAESVRGERARGGDQGEEELGARASAESHPGMSGRRGEAPPEGRRGR